MQSYSFNDKVTLFQTNTHQADTFFQTNKLYLAAFIQANHIFSHKKTLDGELRPRNAKYNDNILIFVQNLFFDLILHTFSLEKYHSPFLHSLGTT